MAYDEVLATRIRVQLPPGMDIREVKMFGGLCFLERGNMAFGVVRDELMVRVGKAGEQDALGQPGARPMDFTGRPMPGMVYVSRKATDDDAGLGAWLERGLRHSGGLPAK